MFAFNMTKTFIRWATGLKLFTLLISLLLAACAEPPVPFRVGTNVWLGYEPLYLARSLGYFDDEDVRMVELPSASEVIQFLRNDRLDAAALTLDELLPILQDGYDLRVVLVMDISLGADVLLVKPEIKTLADLQGRRIGAENTAVGAIMLDAVLNHADLHSKQIKLIPITANAHERAYLQNEVDAIITFEPMRSRLLAQGARQLFDSSRIPDRIVDVLVVSAKAAKKNGRALRRLIQAHFAALDYLQAFPEDAARRMMPRQGLSLEALQTALETMELPDKQTNLRLLGGDSPPLQTTVSELIELMRARRMLGDETINTRHLLEPRWLEDRDS